MDGQDRRISRRAWLAGAGAALAWSASPARALLAMVGSRPLPTAVEALIPQMTLVEKAGQLNLLAAAWAGGAAISLNPAGAAYRNMMDELNSFMAEQRLPKAMRVRIREFFRQTQEFNSMIEQGGILDHMSAQLRGDTALLIGTKVLSKVHTGTDCH